MFVSPLTHWTHPIARFSGRSHRLEPDWHAHFTNRRKVAQKRETFGALFHFDRFSRAIWGKSEILVAIHWVQQKHCNSWFTPQYQQNMTKHVPRSKKDQYWIRWVRWIQRGTGMFAVQDCGGRFKLFVTFVHTVLAWQANMIRKNYWSCWCVQRVKYEGFFGHLSCPLDVCENENSFNQLYKRQVPG